MFVEEYGKLVPTVQLLQTAVPLFYAGNHLKHRVTHVWSPLYILLAVLHKISLPFLVWFKAVKCRNLKYLLLILHKNIPDITLITYFIFWWQKSFWKLGQDFPVFLTHYQPPLGHFLITNHRVNSSNTALPTLSSLLQADLQTRIMWLGSLTKMVNKISFIEHFLL